MMQLQADLAVEPTLDSEFMGHAAHVAEPAASAYVFARQVVHDVAPAPDDEPVGQMFLGALTGHIHPGEQSVHVPVLFS
jgi:hypothetical protein